MLRCETSDDVPRIRGDADQLRQLIMNLILNAADASVNGGEVVVRFRCSASGNGTSLEVSDNGTGIAAEIIERIWSPFFTTKADGTGLGLAISRQIAQQHGATIQIRSQLGKGTVVTVIFPEQPQ